MVLLGWFLLVLVQRNQEYFLRWILSEGRRLFKLESGLFSLSEIAEYSITRMLREHVE
jgi:hypothetical protein